LGNSFIIADIGMTLIAVITTMQNVRPSGVPKRRAQKACLTYLTLLIDDKEGVSMDLKQQRD
jgi:hypothetical protein